MSKFSRYFEIENLYKVPEILQELEVVVTEKVHGTSVRFGAIDKKFRVGGRNEEFDLENSKPYVGMGFMGWLRQTDVPERIRKLAAELKADIIFYGEWHGEGIPRRKGIRYLKGKDIRIFDVRINDDFQNWDEVVRLTEKIGLKTVPLLYRGAPSQELFDQLRVRASQVAYENGVGSEDNLLEGVVIKPVVMRRNERGRWIMAKHKNARWQERTSLKKKKPKLEIPSDAKAFVEEFFTGERLEHVLTYLRESGTDIASPRAIGLVIRGMFNDVVKEAKEEWTSLPEEAKRGAGKIHPSRTKALLAKYLSEEGVAK